MSATGELQVTLYPQKISRFMIFLSRKSHVPSFSVFKLLALNQSLKTLNMSLLGKLQVSLISDKNDRYFT